MNAKVTKHNTRKYETTDGTMHKTVREADAHQEALDAAEAQAKQARKAELARNLRKSSGVESESAKQPRMVRKPAKADLEKCDHCGKRRELNWCDEAGAAVCDKCEAEIHGDEPATPTARAVLSDRQRAVVDAIQASLLASEDQDPARIPSKPVYEALTALEDGRYSMISWSRVVASLVTRTRAVVAHHSSTYFIVTDDAKWAALATKEA